MNKNVKELIKKNCFQSGLLLIKSKNIGIKRAIDSIHNSNPSIFSIGRKSRIKLYF